MSDSGRPLNRLLQQPSSLLERALLRTGVDIPVSAATRGAVLDALGLEPKPLMLSPVRSLPWRRSALLLAALVVSAVAVAIPIARQVSVEAPPLTSAEVTGARLKGRGAAVAPASAAAKAEPDKTEEMRPANDLTRVVEDSAPARPSPARSSMRNALAAELAALDAARNKLNAGEPQVALGLLEAYYRDFARPRLQLEAEVLRIDALDRAGQSDAARRRAAAFVRNHPKGVLTGRVRRYLEQ